MCSRSRKTEVQHKIARLRNLILEKESDGIYLKQKKNFAWLTAGGTNSISIATELGRIGLLVTQTGVWFIADNIEYPRAVEEEFLEDFGFTGYCYSWLEPRGEGAALKSIMGEDDFISDCEYGRPAINEISRLRYSLDENEIIRFKEIGDSVSEILESTLSNVRPGESENSIVGELMRELWSEGIITTGVACAADQRIARFRHPVPTTNGVKRHLMLSVNAQRGGLTVSLTRFISFGPISSELRNQYLKNVEIECCMIEMTRPGTPVRSILENAFRQYERLGYEGEFQKHHQGGAIGYAAREYKPDLTCNELVGENQGFCWNPSITATKSEDTVIAKKDSTDFVTHPVLFPVVEVSAENTRYHRPGILCL